LAGVPEQLQIEPEQFRSAPPRQMLEAAARGVVGVDHRFVRAVLDRFQEFLPELVRFGTEERRDPVPLYLFLIDIFRARPVPEAIPFLIHCIRQNGLEVFQDELAEVLGRIGPASVTPLLEVYQELPQEEQAEVAFLLASLGVHDPRIYAVLRELLERDPSEGAFLLGVYGDPAALPELERILERRAELDEAVIRDVEEAIRELQEAPESRQWEPYNIYNDYPERAGPVMEALAVDERLELTRSANPEYRLETVASLTDEQLRLPHVRERLLEMAQGDADAGVRGMAWKRLGEADPEDEEIRELMWRRLKDPAVATEERAGALVGLACSGCAGLEPYILEHYERPECRAEALEAMWRNMDPSYRRYFSRHLEDPDVRVRRAAVSGAGLYRMASECKRLEKLFMDEEVRLDALQAYALASPGKVSAMHARQVLRKIEELAGGLSSYEGEVVCRALDALLEAHGKKALFYPHGEEELSEDAW
jgi:HEAT repeat protein